MSMTVDAVLCSECKWFHIGGCMNEEVVKGFWQKRSEDDFCSRGERRVQNE
jgi:hypothetical protein